MPITPFVRKLNKRTHSSNQSIRSAAREGDRTPLFNFVGAERTESPDVTDAVLKVLLVFVLLGISVAVLKLIVELFV
jgi:hypothetical protein